MDLDFWEHFGREILHASRFLGTFGREILQGSRFLGTFGREIVGNVLEEKSYMDLDFWEHFGRETLHGS